MSGEAAVKDYFYFQYGLLLNDRQARRYRSILGDMEAFIAFVSKKLGLDGNDLDVEWAREVLRHEAYPSLDAAKFDSESCSAPADFRAMVLDPLASGRREVAYEAALEWLEACVSPDGHTKLRGAMGRRSRAKLQEYGIAPPRKSEGKGYTRLEYLIESPDETITMLRERLNSRRGQGFALRLGKGSLKHEELSSSDIDDVDQAFAMAMESSIERLDKKEQKAKKEELKIWLNQWASRSGIKYLQSALSNKRHIERHDSEIVVVSKSDHEYLEKIRDQYGYNSLKDAISHLVNTSRKLESAR